MTLEQHQQQHAEWLLNELLNNNKSKVKYIIENLPTINVELDYDNRTTGIYKNDSYELEIEDYWIDFKINVIRYGYEIAGDYETQSEYVETSVDVYIELNAIYQDEQEISIDRVSISKLEKEITKQITY